MHRATRDHPRDCASATVPRRLRCERVATFDLRLVVQLEFTPLEREAQPVFECEATDVLGPRRRVVLHMLLTGDACVGAAPPRRFWDQRGSHPCRGRGSARSPCVTADRDAMSFDLEKVRRKSLCKLPLAHRADLLHRADCPARAVPRRYRHRNARSGRSAGKWVSSCDRTHAAAAGHRYGRPKESLMMLRRSMSTTTTP